MVTKEIIKKIKDIEIKSEILIQEIFTGNYKSSFRGNGIEFEEIREYAEGDEIRDIDWNVTARQNRPFVKKYREERELNVFLMVDISKSNRFGKIFEKIAEITAVIAVAASKNRDRVGALFFSDKVEKFIPAKGGKKHALSILENFFIEGDMGSTTNLNSALEYFEKCTKRRSVLFIISDFLTEGYEKTLKRISMKHDVILINIKEKAMEKIVKGAIYVLEDLETGEIYEADTTFSAVNIENQMAPKHKNLIKVYSDEDYVKKLKIFFRRRK